MLYLHQALQTWMPFWEWVFASNWGVFVYQSLIYNNDCVAPVCPYEWKLNQKLSICSPVFQLSPKRMRSWLKSASDRAAGFRVTSIEADLLLRLMKRNQLRWIGRLIRLLPGSLPLEVFWACPAGIRLGIVCPLWPGNTSGRGARECRCGGGMMSGLPSWTCSMDKWTKMDGWSFYRT